MTSQDHWLGNPGTLSLSRSHPTDRIYRSNPIDRPGEPNQVSAPVESAHSDMPTYTPSSLTEHPNRTRGICGRISQWLWTGWRGTAFEGANSPHLAQKPYQTSPGDCKTCRDHHLACDHGQPQCSHCWSQQLLCFYVEPKPRRSRKAKSTVSRMETVSTQLLTGATV